MIAWRDRHRSFLLRFLLPNDPSSAAFRAACIAAVVIAVVREIVLRENI